LRKRTFVAAGVTLAWKQTKAFLTNEEVCQAVRKYCGYKNATCSFLHCDPQDAKEIAQTYRYPINNWDVFKLQDASFIFHLVDSFIEDILSWNVSNATSTRAMFKMASVFNQDLSSWYVSNVTDMATIFAFAKAFHNKSISSWDVSNVTNMIGMLARAYAFNQDLSSWNVSNVTHMVACSMEPRPSTMRALPVGMYPMCRTCIACFDLPRPSTRTCPIGIFPM
jgi:surface protein